MRPCKQCGRCCVKYADRSSLGTVSEQGFMMWNPKRPDVRKCSDISDMWINPVTGGNMNRCPWLRKHSQQEKYVCGIHKIRPSVCRVFPKDIDQMIRVNCEMMEKKDLKRSRNRLIVELDQLRNGTGTFGNPSKMAL